jgi:hypothetical protein
VIRDDTLQRAVPLLVNPARDTLVADFGGLASDTPFVQRVGSILKILQEALGTPVDIEFAWDGTDFYLLQCRSQSFSAEDAPSPIPRDLAEDELVFSATRHISTGWVPEITHIVYVDADAYGALTDHAQLLAVGMAVSRLNKLLPKRQFILMGPGRWGSRGDIRLGVHVTYSDINNTAVLMEIARKRGEYLPDLSFGTHFFQDLVESSIRYIPLYPDDPGGLLNEVPAQRTQSAVRDGPGVRGWRTSSGPSTPDGGAGPHSPRADERRARCGGRHTGAARRGSLGPPPPCGRHSRRPTERTLEMAAAYGRVHCRGHRSRAVRCGRNVHHR